MNKTEYMNTLKEALEGLPSDIISETLSFYENQFSEGLAAGKSELDITEKLPKPRLVAAQKRADMHYKQFKKKMTPTTFAGLLFTMMSVMVFNFFMLIPTAMYAMVLFSTYIASFIVYLFGIGLVATSLSGVTQMQLTLPDNHSYRSTESYHINIDQDEFKIIEKKFGKNTHIKTHEVAVNIGPQGVEVQKNGATVQVSSENKLANQVEGNDDALNEGFSQPSQFRKYQHIVNIKNHLQKKHVFFGLGVLFIGIGLFLFCLFMTRMTFVWFKKYLLWNLSLLRAPVRTIEQ